MDITHSRQDDDVDDYHYHRGNHGSKIYYCDSLTILIAGIDSEKKKKLFQELTGKEVNDINEVANIKTEGKPKKLPNGNEIPVSYIYVKSPFDQNDREIISKEGKLCIIVYENEDIDSIIYANDFVLLKDYAPRENLRGIFPVNDRIKVQWGIYDLSNEENKDSEDITKLAANENVSYITTKDDFDAFIDKVIDDSKYEKYMC